MTSRGTKGRKKPAGLKRAAVRKLSGRRSGSLRRKDAVPMKRQGSAVEPDATDGLSESRAVDTGGGVGAVYLAYCRRRLMKEYLPRILQCVEELSDEDIWWRPHETSNSAGNLILHLSGNVRQWIVSGLGGAPDARNRAAEFSERGPVPRKELVERITSALREADAALARLKPSKLLEARRIQRYDVTCLDAVSHVVEHFAQHLGQIVYITKLRRGIDLKFYDL